MTLRNLKRIWRKSNRKLVRLIDSKAIGLGVGDLVGLCE